MLYKYYQSNSHIIKQSSEFERDWSGYNQSLKNRGDISIWLSDDVIEQWYEKDRVYNGTGTPNLYSDMARLIVHEIGQVFKLPLRQCESLINSLFKLMKINLKCLNYTVMSKGLKKLNLKQPFYRKAHFDFNKIKALAIDSRGLKCFGHEEGHGDKYGLKDKKKWLKILLAVNQFQIIQNSLLSKSEIQDQSVINELISPIKEKVKHVTADAAYDNNPTYKIINKKFSSADIVIPQQKDARENRLNEFYRNRNILEIKFHGRIGWQKNRDYGKRNISELAIQH